MISKAVLHKTLFGKHIGAVILLSTGFLLATTSSIPQSYAHLEHSARYNGQMAIIDKYYVYQALEPEYARPGEPSQIIFSIQDMDGNDVYDIETMVEIYQFTGNRIQYYPWAKQTVGDFSVPYTFKDQGVYQIVISIADDRINQDRAVVPRSILGDTGGCNCQRTIFNVSISENFGTVYNSAMTVVAILPLTVLGLVLGFNYKDKKRKGLYSNLSKQEILKYAMMFLGLAGGIIHLAVYSEHASVRLAYSVFLLIAGSTQVAYGVMYVLITLYETAGAESKESAKTHYCKTVAVNLIGLIGTVILLGLYTYVVIFPPPLSPNNMPQAIDFGGILAKSVEVPLVIGITYLMIWEKKNLKNQPYNK